MTNVFIFNVLVLDQRHVKTRLLKPMTVFFKNNILSECFILEREIGGGMLHFLIVVCNGGPSCRHS